MPGVSCKAVATQNSSEWPCSMCPIPPGSGLWGWGHPICNFLIFPGHLEFWTPLQIPSWGPPLGCTLLQGFKESTYETAIHRLPFAKVKWKTRILHSLGNSFTAPLPLTLHVTTTVCIVTLRTNPVTPLVLSVTRRYRSLPVHFSSKDSSPQTHSTSKIVMLTNQLLYVLWNSSTFLFGIRG